MLEIQIQFDFAQFFLVPSIDGVLCEGIVSEKNKY